jgi:hypothetical protein
MNPRVPNLASHDLLGCSCKFIIFALRTQIVYDIVILANIERSSPWYLRNEFDISSNRDYSIRFLLLYIELMFGDRCVHILIEVISVHNNENKIRVSSLVTLITYKDLPWMVVKM